MKKLFVAALAIVLSTAAALAQLPGGPGAQIPNSAGGSGGGGGGSGTVTSIATACGVAGGTITTSGTIRGAAADSPVAGTSYSIVDGDCGLIKRSTNAALTTITAGSPAGFTNPTTWFTTIKSDGAAGVTLTPSGVTIDGSGSSITIATGKSLDLYSDGTNYHTLPGNGGGGAAGGTSGQIQTNNGSGGFSGGNLSGDVTTSASLVTTAKGAVPINYVASNWYMAPLDQLMTGGATFTANQIYCRLYQFPTTVTIGTVGLNVTTGGGGNIQVAYYSNNASNRPGALLSNTGSISTTTTGNKSGALGANIQIGPGGSSTGRDVWICVNSDNTTHVLAAYNTQFTGPSVRMGAPTQAGISVAANSIGLDNISCSGANCNGGVSTFGTWPALTGSTWTYNTQVSRFPVQQFQVVSSP